MTTTNVAPPGMSPAQVVRLALGANSSHPADILRAVINDLVVFVPATDNEGGGAVTAEVIADVAARLVTRLSAAVDAMGGGQSEPSVSKRRAVCADPWAERVRAFVQGKKETMTDVVLAHLGEAPITTERRRVALILRDMGWTTQRTMRCGERHQRWFAPGVNPAWMPSGEVTAKPG